MTLLADEVRDALAAHENERPRTQQVHLGPSELGGCREYIRNVIAGSPMQTNDEWPTAAAVGTLVGDYVEHVTGERMGAVTQVNVVTTLPNGLVVSGHADMVFPERNLLADCKTKDGFADVKRYGASLENCVQVSIYTLGLVQAGVLTEGAQAVLLYVDRAGNDQTLHEIVITWEQIENYIEVACDRLNDAIEAQEKIDRGELEYARSLRDKTPPFCYSPKVMCPFRDLCWEGSEWVPDKQITDEDTIAYVEHYAEVRDELKQTAAEKEFLRERLQGVTGITPSGLSVTWPGTGKALYVTRVKEEGSNE